MDNDQQKPADMPESAMPNEVKVSADVMNGKADNSDKEPTGKLQRFKHWYGSKKKISIPLTIVVLLIILAAVPASRYKIAGLVVRQNMQVQVVDSTAGTPVSGAKVQLGSISADTDALGKATLKGVKAGSKDLLVTKKYYKDGSQTVLVPILKPKSDIKVPLTATGRLVKVVVKNLINKQPLANVEIDAAGTLSKTGNDGSATLVLPAGEITAKADLSLDGYNDSSAVIQISSQTIRENDFYLTPAGKAYFLSNRTGKLSIMKANLDGSDAETVLAGTGSEDPNNTFLETSPDQKYVALITQRSASDAGPQLYIISTADDKMLTADTGDAAFAPVGWSGDFFVYTISRKYLQNWQPNAFSIKSYNAKTGQILSLVSTSATGTSNADAQYEDIWQEEIFGGNVVYTKTWYQYPGYINVNGKQNVLAEIKPDGTGSKTLKSVDSATSYISNLRVASPSKVYFGVYDSSSGGSTAYYQLDTSGNVSQNSSINGSYFLGAATVYYPSLTSQKYLWDASRDGKSNIIVGDADGSGQNVVARLDPAFHAYGWYGANYILVSKNDSELYIMPASGVDDPNGLVKITDYQSTGYSMH